MTKAGDLYDDTNIRKHYKSNHSRNNGFECPHKECRANGKQVFYHRLEDFLAHFEFHTNHSSEIPKSAVQSSATLREQNSQSGTFSRASTLSRSPQLAPSLGFSENSTILQGDRSVTSSSVTPLPQNLKEPKMQKTPVSLKIMPKSEDKVPRSLGSHSPQQNLRKKIALAQGRSLQESAIDITIQPQAR
jgi:hypothetical protein